LKYNSACWALVQLGANNAWKNKAIAEIQSLLAAYTNTASSEPIHQRLSAIPMSAWEDEMPVIECVIRETLRTISNGTAFRRNLVDDLRIADKTIDKGAFMAYNFGDVHMNQRYYPEPHKFDPDRFSVTEDDDPRSNIPFLAWGTGRHPCAGQSVPLSSFPEFLYSVWFF
jgi:cytochrome P450